MRNVVGFLHLTTGVTFHEVILKHTATEIRQKERTRNCQVHSSFTLLLGKESSSFSPLYLENSICATVTPRLSTTFHQTLLSRLDKLVRGVWLQHSTRLAIVCAFFRDSCQTDYTPFIADMVSKASCSDQHWVPIVSAILYPANTAFSASSLHHKHCIATAYRFQLCFESCQKLSSTGIDCVLSQWSSSPRLDPQFALVEADLAFAICHRCASANASWETKVIFSISRTTIQAYMKTRSEIPRACYWSSKPQTPITDNRPRNP